MIRFPVIIIFFVGSSFLMSSCETQKTVIPEGIISRDSMIMIMADMHIAEAQLVNAGHQTDIKNFKQAYISSVIKKYELTFEEYNKSFEYYTLHPHEFNDMYEEVIVLISQRQAEFKSSVQQEN